MPLPYVQLGAVGRFAPRILYEILLSPPRPLSCVSFLLSLSLRCIIEIGTKREHVGKSMIKKPLSKRE